MGQIVHLSRKSVSKKNKKLKFIDQRMVLAAGAMFLEPNTTFL